MTNLGRVLAMCRKKADLNQTEAASLTGTCKRQLQRYEAGDCKVPEEFILNAAMVYQAPEIIFEYVNSRPIGERMGGLLLGNVNKNHIAALVKYREELQEALDAVDALIKLTINGISEDSKDDITALYVQAVPDVKTAIVQIEKTFLSLAGVELGIEAHRRHREKCIRRGYLKKEKQPVLTAEKPAAYQLA